MKKFIQFIILFLAFSVSNAQNTGTVCCPEFKLITNSPRSCDPNACKQQGHSDPGGTAPGKDVKRTVACKGQPQTYMVIPNLPGYTFTWTVLGGTIAANPSNPGIITWGNGTEGFMQVIVSSANGKCRDTLTQKVCLIQSPIAGITYSPNPVCAGSPVTFSGITSLGATTYSWDFGNGVTSNLQNPPPQYYTPGGTYFVVLTVSNAITDPKGELVNCGCKDTARIQIDVKNKPGINIYTNDCRKMLCTGDTVEYCTNTTGCTGINWVVSGGSIQSGQGTTCVKVIWDQPSVYPTSVTLNANCPSTCGNSATLNVPVLYPNLPIQGPYTVCPSSTAYYSLPVLSGTFYKWTLSGGGTLGFIDSNSNTVSVVWGSSPGGPFILTCNYTNPYTGCSGIDTIGVYIKPVFQLTGTTPVCTGQTSNIYATGAATGWVFTPPTGFTATPIGSSQMQVLWNTAGSYNITANAATPASFCNSSGVFNIVVNPTPVLNLIAGNNVVCPNQSYTYSVSSNVPGGNFNWTFTSGTGTIAPYGAGNATATAIFTGVGPWTLQASQTANGCTGSASLSITKVGPPPAITLTPSTNICSGQSITASVTGAIPPGGYTWSATPGAVLTGGQGTNSATFTINSNATITLTNCAGSVTATANVNATTVGINQTPGPCNVTLSASPAGGTYAWFLNGNPVGTGNPFVAIENGNYLVSATYGTCKVISTTVVTGITPVVASISAIGSLCNGGTVQLQVPIPANCPGATFTWSNAMTGPVITISSPGTYTVTVSCSNGCTATKSIIIQPCVPVPGCINDLIINTSNCPNPVNLTTNIPAGCTPTSTYWNYGDGYSGSTGYHLYQNAGQYQVYAVMSCVNGTKHCDTAIVTVPMVDSFTSVVSCNTNGWTIQLQDASLYLAAYAGYSILWTVSPPCATLSSSTSSNPTLTVPFGCNPTVTLTISKNGCTLNKSKSFGLPSTAFSIIGDSSVCKDVIYPYSSSYTTGILLYAWNFGDFTTGVTNPISHAFNGTPTNPTIALSITDQFGCVFNTTKPVTVKIPGSLAINPGPLVKICPDCLPPVTLNSVPGTGFAGFQWAQNGANIPSATNSTYQLCNFNASGNYTVSANHSATNCRVTSAPVQVVYQPKPIANIQGQTVQCISGTGSIYLSNSANDPNYTYSWVANPAVTFIPNNTQYLANANVTSTGTYQFILTVTDTSTGCQAKDTFCVYVFTTPTVSIGPLGYLCEGINHTYTATPNNPANIYTWSNGVTGISMTTSHQGTYSVMATDTISGCTGISNSVLIKKRPNVSLFPIGCDTLCDTLKLIPPLPLNSGQNYAGVYTIQWYVDGVLNLTGPVLSLSTLSLGLHTIEITVSYLGDSCKAKSGKYNLFIKNCKACSCAESKWRSKTYSGPNIEEKLECNSTIPLICKKPYTFKAQYYCKDSACPPSVTYKLIKPDNTVQTGNFPLNLTPNQTGIYILTFYGKCGDNICDSCVVKFEVKCEECSCKGSKWEEVTVTVNNQSTAIKCGKENVFDVKCNTPVSVNAGFKCTDANCSGSVTYSLKSPTGGVITGNAPVNFTPNQTGIYTLTLYGKCGQTICDSCVIIFKTQCKEDCCPNKITIENKTDGYDYAVAGKTTLAQNFVISGLSGVNITEVRAQVTDFYLYDNFNGECVKCINLPFTWGSVSSGMNIGAVSPKITLFGGATTPVFSGTGAEQNQNPREIIWNSTNPFVIANGTNLGIKFILPPPSGIDCCELKGKMCVKFTFRDNDCKECEVISCFEFIVKKK